MILIKISCNYHKKLKQTILKLNWYFYKYFLQFSFLWTIFAIFFAKFICAQNICVLNFVLQNCIFYKVSRKNQITNLYFANFLEVYYQRMFFRRNLTSFKNNFLKKLGKLWLKIPKKYESNNTFFSIKSSLQIGIL